MKFRTHARAAAWVCAGLILLAPGNTTPGADRASTYRAQAILLDQTLARYTAVAAQLEQFYRLLSSALKNEPQERLFTVLEPPRQLTHGYQVLPRVLNGRSLRQKASTPTGYSWPWTDKLITEAAQDITYLEAALDGLPGLDRAARRQLFERAVQGYLQLRNRMQNIDAHIQYNRFWQSAIARDRAGYDRETQRFYRVVERDSLRQSLLSLSAPGARAEVNWLDALPGLTLLEDRLKSRAAALTSQIDSNAATPQIPSFLRVEQSLNGWTVKVPIYTDIEDAEFVRIVKEKIEKIWHVRRAGVEFAVELNLTFISPVDLYWGEDVPNRGTTIDLERHLGLFPEDGAILTTGTVSTHVSGRAIVLGAHDIDGRILAHEFGHILGFRDSYVRGYKDLGANGFAVLEAVIDPTDIMGRSDIGAVLPAHFEKILEQVFKKANTKNGEKKDKRIPRQQFAAAGPVTLAGFGQ